MNAKEQCKSVKNVRYTYPKDATSTCYGDEQDERKDNNLTQFDWLMHFVELN